MFQEKIQHRHAFCAVVRANTPPPLSNRRLRRSPGTRSAPLCAPIRHRRCPTVDYDGRPARVLRRCARQYATAVVQPSTTTVARHAFCAVVRANTPPPLSNRRLRRSPGTRSAPLCAPIRHRRCPTVDYDGRPARVLRRCARQYATAVVQPSTTTVARHAFCAVVRANTPPPLSNRRLRRSPGTRSAPLCAPIRHRRCPTVDYDGRPARVLRRCARQYATAVVQPSTTTVARHAFCAVVRANTPPPLSNRRLRRSPGTRSAPLCAPIRHRRCPTVDYDGRPARVLRRCARQYATAVVQPSTTTVARHAFCAVVRANTPPPLSNRRLRRSPGTRSAPLCAPIRHRRCPTVDYDGRPARVLRRCARQYATAVVQPSTTTVARHAFCAVVRANTPPPLSNRRLRRSPGTRSAPLCAPIRHRRCPTVDYDGPPGTRSAPLCAPIRHRRCPTVDYDGRPARVLRRCARQYATAVVQPSTTTVARHAFCAVVRANTPPPLSNRRLRRSPGTRSAPLCAPIRHRRCPTVDYDGRPARVLRRCARQYATAVVQPSTTTVARHAFCAVVRANTPPPLSNRRLRRSPGTRSAPLCAPIRHRRCPTVDYDGRPARVLRRCARQYATAVVQPSTTTVARHAFCAVVRANTPPPLSNRRLRRSPGTRSAPLCAPIRHRRCPTVDYDGRPARVLRRCARQYATAVVQPSTTTVARHAFCAVVRANTPPPLSNRRLRRSPGTRSAPLCAPIRHRRCPTVDYDGRPARVLRRCARQYATAVVQPSTTTVARHAFCAVVRANTPPPLSNRRLRRSPGTRSAPLCAPIRHRRCPTVDYDGRPARVLRRCARQYATAVVQPSTTTVARHAFCAVVRANTPPPLSNRRLRRSPGTRSAPLCAPIRHRRCPTVDYDGRPARVLRRCARQYATAVVQPSTTTVAPARVLRRCARQYATAVVQPSTTTVARHAFCAVVRANTPPPLSNRRLRRSPGTRSAPLCAPIRHRRCPTVDYDGRPARVLRRCARQYATAVVQPSTTTVARHAFCAVVRANTPPPLSNRRLRRSPGTRSAPLCAPIRHRRCPTVDYDGRPARVLRRCARQYATAVVQPSTTTVARHAFCAVVRANTPPPLSNRRLRRSPGTRSAPLCAPIRHRRCPTVDYDGEAGQSDDRP